MRNKRAIKFLAVLLTMATLSACNGGSSNTVSSSNANTSTSPLQAYINSLAYTPATGKNLTTNSTHQQSFSTPGGLIINSIDIKFYSGANCTGSIVQTHTLNGSIETPVTPTAGTYTSSNASNKALCSSYVNGTQADHNATCTGLYADMESGNMRSMQFIYNLNTGASGSTPITSACMYNQAAQVGATTGVEGIANWATETNSAQCNGGNCGFSQNYNVNLSPLIIVTPSVISPSISSAGYFTVNINLIGDVSSDQNVSLSNNSTLQALGVLAISNQNTNLTSCILNNSTTSCTFNVIASAPTQNFGIKQLTFNNSGIANLTIESLNFTLTSPPSLTGTIQLPQTGQTTIYTAYDDANFLMGYPWINNAAQATTPAARFTDDGCQVTDNLTGLIWLKDPTVASATTLTWANSLTTANSGTWCGQSAGAWRVPNVNELFSLMNLGESNVADWLDGSNGRTCAGSCFNAIESTYWSSSVRSNTTSKSWYITMATGKINSISQTTNYWLLPVRGTSTGLASIPKTGESQTVPLNPAPAGSDGNLMKGTAWPTPRFTVGSGTTANCITDNLTGLTWLRDGNLANGGATLAWEPAIKLASTGSWCGYTDWRMPNQIEILSLVNYGQQYLTWLSDAGFLNLSVNQYWSSTTVAQDKSKAWAATLRQGGTNNYSKISTSSGSLLPVRGGVGANG